MALFLDYDADELDHQYNVHAWVEDPEAAIKAEVDASLEQRGRLLDRAQLDISYGPSDAEKLDIFVGAGKDMPVRVFFHGGGWRMNSKEKACYAAEMHVDAGAIYVTPDFAKIDQVPLDEIICQSRAAVAWVYTNIAEYGGDPGRIYVGGISSGAHQTGMVLGTDWSEFGLPADTLMGGVCASGIYDLAPLMLTPRKEVFNLDDEGVRRLSPIQNIPAGALDIICGIAENDTPEFHRQSEAYYAAWQNAGHRVQLIEVPGANHFSNSLALGDAGGPLGRACLAQMSLS